jgi:uncharacterized glyoxalase superfamily protein PhnB
LPECCRIKPMEVAMATTGSAGKIVGFGQQYRDAKAAIEWLCRAFGFEKHAVYEGPDGKIMHAELTLGGGMVMLGSARDDEYGKRFKMPDELDGAETRSAYIVVPDADAAFERAVASGASVVSGLKNTDYGSRDFTVRDPEGYTWSVGTYDPWARHE